MLGWFLSSSGLSDPDRWARPFELGLEDKVWKSRPEMAAQRLEKIESAPGNGMGSEAANLLDLVHGRD